MVAGLTLNDPPADAPNSPAVSTLPDRAPVPGVRGGDIICDAMIRKAIILLLSLATFVTGGLWVLSHLEWPGEWNISRFGVDIEHTPDCFSGSERPCWRVEHSDYYRFLTLAARLTKGRIRLMLFDPSLRMESEMIWQRRLAGLYIMSLDGGLCRALGIPLWMPFTLFAAYPVIAFIRGPLRRYRRRKRGRCIHCGYNLTGNVTGVCSECGEPIGNNTRKRAAALTAH